MNITMQALLDYLQCPTLYKYRHIDKTDVLFRNGYGGTIKTNINSLEESFDVEMHKIGYHIFNYIQDGRYPSMYLLRQKWSQLWLKGKTKQDILFEDNTKHTMTPARKLEKKGVKAIEFIHPKFKENPGTPLLVGKKVNLKIGRHTVEVTIDLVREVEIDGVSIIEIIDFQTGIKMKNRNESRPMNLHIHHDFTVTAASMAFRQLTGASEDRIVYYDMINDREYITKREERDYKALENVMNHVETALSHNIFYPVMNDRCYECPFQRECKGRDWDVTENVDPISKAKKLERSE